MVMQGSLQLAQYSIEDRAETLKLIGDAMHAAERAAELTQRLLAFGRKQSLQPISIDTAKLLVSLSAMMSRTLGTQVTIETHAEEDIWSCFADQVQLESALLNLAINARDALGSEGGLLTLEASNWVAQPSSSGEQSELEPGDYLRFDVSDNGPGFDRETLSRAFEPFFTTKDIGCGSGLGLSMVYGFTQQSGGHVSIASEVGKGTTVSVFLPKGGESASKELTHSTEPAKAGLGIHVLMVEDVPVVARVTKQILELHGYRVSVTENGEAALALLPEIPDVAILLTDVGLPGRLNGVSLSHEVLARRPDMLVLFMTGFDNGLLDGIPEASVLKKPFRAHALASALEELITSAG
ncbi:MAG: response regulator, partial [Kofleriaceae bacterium]|nr:response regulator [Kofleriaceae bacterium]